MRRKTYTEDLRKGKRCTRRREKRGEKEEREISKKTRRARIVEDTRSKNGRRWLKQ